MSQADLASEADVSQVTISKIERGESDPRLSTMVRIEQALGGFEVN